MWSLATIEVDKYCLQSITLTVGSSKNIEFSDLVNIEQICIIKICNAFDSGHDMIIYQEAVFKLHQRGSSSI